MFAKLNSARASALCTFSSDGCVKFRQQLLGPTVIAMVDCPDHLPDEPSPFCACVARPAWQVAERIYRWVGWEIGCCSKDEIAEIIRLQTPRGKQEFLSYAVKSARRAKSIKDKSFSQDVGLKARERRVGARRSDEFTIYMRIYQVRTRDERADAGCGEILKPV
jgi:hypothetical protein